VGASQRAFKPALSTGLKASAARFASSDSALHGKIHQVIGAVVDGMRRSFSARPSFKISKLKARSSPKNMILTYVIVKFDTDKLPPILNALETMNGDQRLVLEVAVRILRNDLDNRTLLLMNL
jgi:hypothetical protein